MIAPSKPIEVFGRCIEQEELGKRLYDKQSFLLHGPAGVGKTVLLSLLFSKFPNLLYSAQNPTPQILYQNLAAGLLAERSRILLKACKAGAETLRKKTAAAVRGIVRDALQASPHVVILDHLARPSHLLAGAVRELMVDCSVPVVAVSRSAHMEDAGFVLPFFPDRTEKFAIRNFDPGMSVEFAKWCADREKLTAGNLAQFLEQVAEFSDGNPGAIMQMIRMAHTPKYSSGGHIKATPLYIDFRIVTISQ